MSSSSEPKSSNSLFNSSDSGFVYLTLLCLSYLIYSYIYPSNLKPPDDSNASSPPTSIATSGSPAKSVKSPDLSADNPGLCSEWARAFSLGRCHAREPRKRQYALFEGGQQEEDCDVPSKRLKTLQTTVCPFERSLSNFRFSFFSQVEFHVCPLLGSYNLPQRAHARTLSDHSPSYLRKVAIPTPSLP